MPDPHAPSPDALDAALIALDAIESHHLDQNARKGRDPSRSTALKLVAEARAAVRRLAERGEAFTVESIIVPGEADRGRVPVVIFDDNCPTCPRPGDRVLVRRAEEGT